MKGLPSGPIPARKKKVRECLVLIAGVLYFNCIWCKSFSGVLFCQKEQRQSNGSKHRKRTGWLCGNGAFGASEAGRRPTRSEADAASQLFMSVRRPRAASVCACGARRDPPPVACAMGAGDVRPRHVRHVCGAGPMRLNQQHRFAFRACGQPLALRVARRLERTVAVGDGCGGAARARPLASLCATAVCAVRGSDGVQGFWPTRAGVMPATIRSTRDNGRRAPG